MKNIIITGGNDGIGLELVKILAGEGHRLGLLLREESRKKALEDIPGAENFEYFYADLADREQLLKAAEAIGQQFPVIDLLFNNAGIQLSSIQESKQGNEMHYEVNTLAPYILTQILRPNLAKAIAAKVINTSSGAAKMAGDLKIDKLIQPGSFNKMNGPYAQSKLALSYWTYLLAEAYQKQNILLCSVDPGGNKTKLTEGNVMPLIFRLLRPIIFKSPDYGANLLYQAAFAPENAHKSGVFLMKNQEVRLKIFDGPLDKGRALLELLDKGMRNE